MDLLTFDQQMEFELVQGAFSEGIGDVSTDPTTGHPSFTFAAAASSDVEQEVLLRVTLPPTYPDSDPPILELESISTSRRIQTDRLLAQLKTLCADMGTGMPILLMVFQRLQELLADLDAAAAAKAADDADKAAMRDPTIRLGQPMTPDLFAQWIQQHAAQKKKLLLAAGGGAGAAEAASAEGGAAAGAKLTGRQMWDSTIREADWQLFGADEADAEEFIFEDAGDDNTNNDDNPNNGDGEADGTTRPAEEGDDE